MSIFSRLFKIGQAKVNQVVDSMEDPATLLDQAIRDKETQIRDLRSAVAKCIATLKGTEAQLLTEKREKEKQKTLQNDVDTLKSEMSDIKSLLLTLVQNQKGLNYDD